MVEVQTRTLDGRAPHGARGLKFVRDDIGPASRSRAPHGARGLKFHLLLVLGLDTSRAPHGARGLKSLCCLPSTHHLPSRPTRGAWIEIGQRGGDNLIFSRAPHGARGLKYFVTTHNDGTGDRRAPHGARGLKYAETNAIAFAARSRPTRGAWIEINFKSLMVYK